MKIKSESIKNLHNLKKKPESLCCISETNIINYNYSKLTILQWKNN